MCGRPPRVLSSSVGNGGFLSCRPVNTRFLLHCNHRRYPPPWLIALPPLNERLMGWAFVPTLELYGSECVPEGE